MTGKSAAKIKLTRATRKFVRSVRDTLHVDDDILSPEAKSRLTELAQAVENGEVSVVNAAARRDEIVPPGPGKSWRDWLDVLAVAGAVAMGLRALFLQPFNIPTSSMQPTLFGVHFVQKAAGEGIDGQGAASRILHGADKVSVVVERPGVITNWREADGNSVWTLGGVDYTLPGSAAKAADYAGLDARVEYPAGAKLADGFMVTGDHLFVDRVSHHFVDFRRGDVAVFTTEGLYGMDKTPLLGYYYIKRIVGVPGDTLKIRDDVLYIRPAGAAEFRPVYELDERFQKIYSRKGGYHGHSNLLHGDSGLVTPYSKYLRTPEDEFTVPAGCYFMMGDNSRFSADSRVFGSVPGRNMIGRALNVFWPLSRRWGLADSPDPLDVPTSPELNTTFKEMFLQ